MRKGCGCFGYTLAALLGLVIGGAGLGVAGWFWVSAQLFDPGPAAFSQKGWSAAHEAALAIKLAPVERAVRNNESSTFTLTLTHKEANRLFQQFLLDKLSDRLSGEIEFGDTAMVVRYSRRVDSGRYVNGELRAEVKGARGDFTAQVYSLSTGRFKWPAWALPEVGKWLEGVIETQRLWARDPWRLGGIKRIPFGVQVEVKTIKH